jgi:hypothetical protein
VFGEELFDAIPGRVYDVPAFIPIIWKITIDKTAYAKLIGAKAVEVVVYHVGSVALAATMFGDDRFVSEKLAALIKGLDGHCDIRSFVESQSSEGKISLFSVVAALQAHTTPKLPPPLITVASTFRGLRNSYF